MNWLTGDGRSVALSFVVAASGSRTYTATCMYVYNGVLTIKINAFAIENSFNFYAFL